MKSILITLTSIFLFGAAATAVAETLEVPVGSQSRAGIGQIPLNGQMKQDVINLIGNPAAQRGPVGDPPITAWDYGTFVVYFEYDVVLHTVVKPRL